MKRIKTLFLLIISLVGTLIVLKEVVRPYYLTSLYIESDRYQNKVAALKKKVISNSTTLLIGNSLMVGYDSSKLNTPAVKWAIPGDVLDGLKWRTEALIEKNPQAIIINLGVNDILNGFGFSAEKLETYLLTFKSNFTNTRIYIMSLSPENLNSGLFTSPLKIAKEITRANENIKRLCNEHSMNYIDVYSRLQLDGRLNEKYSHDGLHLSNEGYEIWTEVIKESIISTP